MVRFFYISLLLLIIPFASSAQDASFEAYIDRENVSVGETFQMKFELIGVQAQSAPDISQIPSDLLVINQQQQTNITYINNVQSQDTSWILDVVPQKEGAIKVPAIEVKTASGSLYTKPFKVFVKPASQISSNTNDNSVFIDVQLEKQEAYIDEPVLYKTTVYHLAEISNAELVKPKADNAIVEQISEPKPSRQILNGINYKVIEVEYVITPIKTGVVNIEPSILRGKLAKNSAGQPRGSNPLDSLFAPFGQGSGIANPMIEMVPFTVASKKLRLNAKPADSSVNPWLVLYNLKIDDELNDVQIDDQNKRVIVKAGEPITRKIRLTAYGKGGESLPDLENSFNSSDFKVYADKPEDTKEIIDGDSTITSRIKGTRTQTFTFIPQKTGMLTLPELNVSYFDLRDDKPAKANLPGKVVTSVASNNPSPNSQTQPEKAAPVVSEQTNNTEEQVEQEKKPEVKQEEKQESLINKIQDLTVAPQMPNFVLLLLSFIICVIMFISFKVLTQARYKKEDFDEDLVDNKLNKNLSTKNFANPRKIINFATKKHDVNVESSFITQINSSKTHEELQQILQKYAAKNLGLSQNSGSVLIAQQLHNKYNVDKQSSLKYAAELDSVLYASKQIDLEYLKNGFVEIISQAEENMKNNKPLSDEEKLISLNP